MNSLMLDRAPVYSTSDLSALLNISMRQITTWTQKGLTPETLLHGRERRYNASAAVLVALVADLRRRNISLQVIRRHIRGLRRVTAKSAPRFVIVGRYVSAADSPDDLLELLARIRHSAHVIDTRELLATLRIRRQAA